MNGSHIESIFNNMIDDVAYIKLATYEIRQEKFLTRSKKIRTK